MWAFDNPSIWDKLGNIQQNCDDAMKLRTLSVHEVNTVPAIPARDIVVLEAKQHPPKKGFGQKEGLARMLHDLAGIELQAMELGLRTLVEFPEAPQGFRDELHAVTLSESQHLGMCLQGIQDLGFQWGDWPVHCALWSAVAAEDTILDRILIVHRYLEGSGLEAGEGLVKRLEGANSPGTRNIVKQINFEEIGHVDFGSRWYREICHQEKRNSVVDFPERMLALRERLPKRVEKISREIRRKAGFTEAEIDWYENLRAEFLIPYKIRLDEKAKAAEDIEKR